MAAEAHGASVGWRPAVGFDVQLAGWLERHAAAVGVLLFAVNLALKAPLVAAQGIWFDEAVTIRNGHARFDLLASLAADATPPLYALLVQTWMAVFGVTLEAARALSVLLSAATAVLLFRLGRRFVDPATGLWAALLFTASRYQLHYGHEARPYALVGLLCVASIHALLLLLERPTRARVVALAALDAALLYTHYVAGLLLAVQPTVALLRAGERRRNVTAVMTSQALALAAFVPCMLYVASVWPLPMAGWLTEPGPRAVLDLVTGFAGSTALLWVDGLLLAGGLAAIALSGSSQARADSGTPGWTTAATLAIWAFLPLALAIVASRVVPIFLDRYLLYASLGLYFLLAWVLVRLPVRPALRHGVALALCVLSLLTAWRDPIVRTDWRAAAERVQAASDAGALTVVAPPHQLLPLAYHLSPAAFADREHLAERLRDDRVLALASPSDVLAILPAPAPPLLVVMTDASAARHAALVPTLERGGLALLSSEGLDGLVLLRFARAGT